MSSEPPSASPPSPGGPAPDAPVTRALARFAADLRFDDLPGDVVEHAKMCLLDTLGCGLFGSTLDWSRILTGTLARLDTQRSVAVWGTRVALGAPHAALANGAAVHGFELDDLHKEAILHPGAVVAPAVLAACAAGVSGQELLTALAAGYEVGARVGMAAGTAHLLAGWHPTGTHGTLAAAAGAARVLGLDPARTQHALGIAGTQAGGLMASQFSSMVKRFHAGRAAQSGLYAAHLAANGYTGIANLLESDYGGYLSTLSPTGSLTDVASGLLDRWELRRVGFKPYSTNGSCHPAIDVVLRLRREAGLSADEVEAVRVWVSSATAAHVGWPYEPGSVTTAQMNLPYIVAVVLTDGQAFVDQFRPERVASPDLVALSRRVSVIADREIDAAGPGWRHATRLEVALRDGRVLRGAARSAKGSESLPLTGQETRAKFRGLAAKAAPPDRVARIEECVDRLDSAPDAQELAGLLAAPETREREEARDAGDEARDARGDARDEARDARRER